MPESAIVVGPVGRSVSSRRRVLAGGSGEGERGWPLRLGVLTEQIGPALVDEVMAAAGGTQRRGGGGAAGGGWLLCGGRAGAAPGVGFVAARLVRVRRPDSDRPDGLPAGVAVADQRAAAATERAA